MLFWGLTKIPNLNIQPNTETYMGFKVNGRNVYGQKIEIATPTLIGYGHEHVIQTGVDELLDARALYKGNDSGADWFPFPSVKQSGNTMDYSSRVHICITSQNKLWIAGSKSGAETTIAVKGYVLYTKVNE